MLTLFDTALSLNYYKVRLLLALLEVPYVRRPIDLRKEEHRPAKMLSINPFGQVPVLSTGNLALRDSSSILVWVARQYGDARWMPSNPDDEARVNAWLHPSALELRLGPYEARLRKRFPAIRSWLDRVRSLDGYVALTD